MPARVDNLSLSR